MRTILIVAVVVAATLAGAVTALGTFQRERRLDVGTVRLSVDPFHRGALDLYVPLVDWGVRFPVVRLPARVNVDVRSVDREAVVRLAESGRFDAAPVRAQARDALASYLRLAILVAVVAGLAFGALVAVAVRGGRAPRLRSTLSAAVVTALGAGAALVVLLPPRSNVERPEYYANGPEVPAALRTLRALGASAKTLDEEIDEQLVGIARLVNAPAGRPALADDLPRPSSRRSCCASRAPGDRLVFVSGNHDSDVLERKLARSGAVVLTRGGRLRGDGSTDGRVVQRLAGLRIAGYDDPLKRRAGERYRDHGARYTRAQQERFAAWLRRLRGRVDVVIVHAPALARLALQERRREPPRTPLLLVAGHTHRQSLERIGGATLLNPGSLGGGGTGNLAEVGGEIGLVRVTYARTPRFTARAADLVQIDPGDGEAQARRFRLDEAGGASR